MRTTAEVTEKLALLYPDKTAFISGETRLSFKEVHRRVKNLAAALLALGLKPGDRVAAIMKINHRSLELPFAAGMAGLVFVPINTMLVQREVQVIMQDAGARAIITGESHRKMLEALRPELPELTIQIGVDMTGEAYDSGWLNYDELAATDKSLVGVGPVSEDDLSILIYTSGTTGVPKGVMITHRMIISNATNFILETPIAPENIYLATLPGHHIALLSHLSWVVRGCTVVVTPFEPSSVARLIEAEKVTDTLLVPTMVQAILNSLENTPRDLTSLSNLIFAAAPMSEALLRRGLAMLGPIFVQMYGLTESSSLCTLLRKADHNPDGSPEVQSRLISCGREITRAEVRVVDPQGQPVPPGKVGEVVIRGDTVTPGYWNKPEETALAIRNGWLYTGDLGRVDQDNYIFLVDRRKDMIISGGVNVYPREIEEVLYKHPAIQDVAVVGVPHPKWGEAVHAVLVLKPGHTLSDEELEAFCSDKLGFKRPRSYERWPELPRNATGKILKRDIRDQYWSGRTRQIV
jgi:long-chain acyl-CoA synthetase